MYSLRIAIYPCYPLLFSGIEMTSTNDAGSLIGHCRVNIKKDGIVPDYLFTENGFEFMMISSGCFLYAAKYML